MQNPVFVTMTGLLPRSFCFVLPTCLPRSGYFVHRLAIHLGSSYPDPALANLYSLSASLSPTSTWFAPRAPHRLMRVLPLLAMPKKKSPEHFSWPFHCG